MSSPLSRRRLLTIAVPGLLAGCFEEPDATGSPDDGDADGTDGESPDSGELDDGGGEGSGGDDGGDPDDEGGNSDDEGGEPGGEDGENGSDGGATATPPERVAPEDAGITVTDIEIVDVSEDGYRTTVTSRLTVRNDGRFTYGFLEFRTDAYATAPNSRDREVVGYEYTTRRFSSDDRFADGTRQVNVAVTFRSRDAGFRPNPDRYEVTAAVRRAEPAAE